MATTTIAAYCRISKDPARLEIGVDRQRADCLELVNRTWPGAEVRWFVDNDLSAADPAVERPGWRAMLDALRCGEVDQIVAYDQSRLTRQPIEWEQLLIVLGRRGIGSLHTVREGERDVAEGGGRMVSRIIAAVDAEYAEVTRTRVRRAMRQLAAEGRPVGGRLFGYVPAIGDDGRKTREIVPREAEAVRWAAACHTKSVQRAVKAASGTAQLVTRTAWRPSCPAPVTAGLATAPAGRRASRCTGRRNRRRVPPPRHRVRPP